ncbi:hypothetical protein [Dyadobacter frigoris]|uniref:Uncharacterized protein n=1 Tax=Dyadobacter frigoris TaxID=2576211 RepID=A0A4U6CLX6_9BACT|nr:hypothetical protein [Dyadobacter frigoris]TKT85290.1 hypothetical protein FDK13_34125 [Dyadobacter frigoris]GLU54748.1 hypothetical protein Dfri01_42090 [Dyadobacter frigoris]
MNKPTPEELQSFFRSDLFQSESARNGDYTLAIKVFYERFYSEFDQSKYSEIGIHIDNIRCEQLIFDEQTDNSHTTEYKTIIDFHFIQDPANKQSFSLIGTEEEKAFYDLNIEELLNFFILRFRRFSKLFIH